MRPLLTSEDMFLAVSDVEISVEADAWLASYDLSAQQQQSVALKRDVSSIETSVPFTTDAAAQQVCRRNGVSLAVRSRVLAHPRLSATERFTTSAWS